MYHLMNELRAIKCELVTQNVLFCMKEKYNLGQISKDEYTESINGIYSNLRDKMKILAKELCNNV